MNLLLQLLFILGRVIDVAARGLCFIITFSKVLSENEVCVWAVIANINLGMGDSFTIQTRYNFSSFSFQKNIPFCLREVWVITACMALVRETGKQFRPNLFTVEAQKEFYRLQADLYSLARVKVCFS